MAYFSVTDKPTNHACEILHVFQPKTDFSYVVIHNWCWCVNTDTDYNIAISFRTFFC